MAVVVVTGSLGLIGSEAALHFGRRGFTVVGLDNDMRRYFFGADASTAASRARLERELGDRYVHHALDVREAEGVRAVFAGYGDGIAAVIHTAGQPSHDWAAREPMTDFSVNAVGTLVMLEAARAACPGAAFVFCSTNKVYGDRPNTLPLVERDTRWELPDGHPSWQGVAEDMSLDHSLHSIFGASKVAADVMVQEYGRYFGMKTACYRGGTLTGPQHAGAELHGFLSYLMKCAMTGTPYTIFGYKGKQVRDVIHCTDVVRAFEAFVRAPRSGETYNLGGGRQSHASVLETIEIAQRVTGRTMTVTYADAARRGDHIWYVSDLARLKAHYPGWDLTYDGVEAIAREIHDVNRERWRPG